MKVQAERRPSDRNGGSSKDRSLEPFREHPEQAALTTDQGVRVHHTDDSLKAGQRGPTLLEDFHLREKITRFDHERIPERVVHARGSGAHGFFEVYESMANRTRASFLQDPQAKTPVFVRFSTVVGSRGSADTVRDVRGFAVKFYTEEGNFDLVGNNIPVFFIQDGIKFPDLVHAVKPEPHYEMPQAASAHDTFWDFVGLQPETLHMVMWVMSDRAHPAQLPDDGGLRRPHLPADQRPRQGVPGEVPLEAAARRALARVGRGAEARRHGPRLPPPRPVGGHRGRRVPGIRTRRAGRRRERTS